MDKLIHGVLRHRRAVIAVFAVAAILGAALFFGVKVNYDLTDYLPEDEESTRALSLMTEEFSAAVPNARALVSGVSLTQALEYKERIAEVDGVSEVMWLDDVWDVKTPIETADASLVEQYYKNGDALFRVTIPSDVMASRREVARCSRS